MKSSAAIFAAVTEPSPALSEYGPEASLRMPIFMTRAESASAGEHMAAIIRLPTIRDTDLMRFIP